MNVPALAVEDFGLWVLERDTRRNILTYPQTFSLPVPGVYTVEGDNLAGKSTLVKMIMGALPQAVQEQRPRITVYGQEAHVTSVRDAYQYGLAAVFQDDALVTTMTVREQILMRHANPSLLDVRNWTWNLILAHLLHTPIAVMRHIGVRVGHFATRAAERESAIEDHAASLLDTYGPIYGGILDLYPAQLSGGATAVAKLLNAQLTEGLRVLFLDEAFAGVQRDVRPRLIDDIKRWAQREGTTVVAVSHDTDELMRWQPVRRYEISGGLIREIRPRGYSRLQPGVPLRQKAFPIYVCDESDAVSHPWVESFEPPFWVILDAAVAQSISAGDLVTAVQARDAAFDGRNLTLVSIPERAKTLDTYLDLITRGADILPPGRGTIIAVGGGIILNVAAFVASTLHRGRSPHVLIPTTLMALADVAVGSKTGLNYLTPTQAPRKHVIGTYANPHAVVVDRRFFKSLPGVQKKLGLVECLKHGLTEDVDLFNEVDYLLSERDPDRARSISAAWRTLDLKSRLVALDPWEESVGRLLLYGHTHAAALETASSFSLPHGLAVLWGILLDLYLTGSRDLYEQILARERGEWRLFAEVAPGPVSLSALEAAYDSASAVHGGTFESVRLGSIAEYAHTRGDLRIETVTFTAVFEAVRQLRSALGFAAKFLR